MSHTPSFPTLFPRSPTDDEPTVLAERRPKLAGMFKPKEFKEKFPRTSTDTSALNLLKGISHKQLHPLDQQPTHAKS